MGDGDFQAGTWIQLPSNCTRSFSLTYLRCAEYGIQAIRRCDEWASKTTLACISWAWKQARRCSDWAWLFCAIFAIIVTAVCLAFGIVVVIFCAVFTFVEMAFCLVWTLVSITFCLSNANGGTAFLLTDGSVLMQESMSIDLLGIGRTAAGTHRWWKLTPDKFGSYAKGSWSRLADSAVGRKYYASGVLADGRVVVCGGEISDSSGVIQKDWTNTCEIYNPLTDKWISFAPPTTKFPEKTWEQIGDAPCAVLPDGRFLLGSINDENVAWLDPSALIWTALSPRPVGSVSDEESWVLMPDNTIALPSTFDKSVTWVYEIGNDHWVRGNDLPNVIVDPDDNEIGPGLLRYDGTAFFLGANEHTAIYRPSAGALFGWANGPDLPDQEVNGQQMKIGIHDGPGALLANGNVLFGAGIKIASAETSPSWFFEFDGITFHRANDPPNYVTKTNYTRLLVLPNADVLFCSEDSSSFYAYHSDAAVPQDSFRPVIQSCPTSLMPGTSVQISGLQFNGLSQAVGYGDDYTAATNYPLVRIVNNQNNDVKYCRTHDHNTVNSNGDTIPSMGVATGAAVITTNVEIPNDIESGDSQLFVVANGIASEPFAVTVGSIIIL